MADEQYCISRDFRVRDHTGVDLATVPARSGGSVRSIFRGRVILSVSTIDSAGFGNVVLIEHTFSDGVFYSLYAHLEDGSIAPQGFPVDTGTPIGRLGKTGKAERPHLHFAIKTTPTLGCGYINSNCQSERATGFSTYSDPIKFIADHVQETKTLASFTPSTFGIEGPAGNLRCGIKRSAQTFIPTVTGTLTDVVLRIRKNEQAGTNNSAIFVSIAGGIPMTDPPNILERSQATIPVQSLTTDSFATSTFTFSGSTMLVAGKTYSIILDSTAFSDCANDISVGGSGQIPDMAEWTGTCNPTPPGPYRDGAAYKQFASDGTWHIETPCDFFFIVMGKEVSSGSAIPIVDNSNLGNTFAGGSFGRAHPGGRQDAGFTFQPTRSAEMSRIMIRMGYSEPTPPTDQVVLHVYTFSGISSAPEGSFLGQSDSVSGVAMGAFSFGGEPNVSFIFPNSIQVNTNDVYFVRIKRTGSYSDTQDYGLMYWFGNPIDGNLYHQKELCSGSNWLVGFSNGCDQEGDTDLNYRILSR
jgi:hypothetical protein